MFFLNVILTCVLGGIYGQQNGQLTVSNITVMTGTDAYITLNTQISVEYFKLQKTSPFKIVFDSKSLPNPKYELHGNGGNYSIKIKSIDKSDGRSYAIDTKEFDTVSFNIIVIDSLVPLSYSNNYTLGNQMTLNCSLTWYGAGTNSKNYFLATEVKDMPILSMLVGTINQDLPGSRQIVDPDDIFHHFYFMSANVTISKEMEGKNLTCQVKSGLITEPIYNSQYIPIPFPVQNVSIYNNMSNGWNQIGDFVNCSSRGYPPPVVTWVPVSMPPGCPASSQGGFQSYAVLILTCQGTQSWNCTASNTVNGMQRSVGMLQSFNVFANSQTNPNNTMPSTEQSNAVGLGVGLGIGLGVPILIGLIALICCLMKRRKAQDSIKKKPPTNVQKKTTTTTATAPPQKSSNVGVNLNPNPAFPVPVYNEQKTNVTMNPGAVRGSSGMADLGVRTVSKSGSLSSHLNESVSDQGSHVIRSVPNNTTVV